MKETPREKIILANFQSGTISKSGFLGNDTRHIHDIVHDDLQTLTRLGVTQGQIADFLQLLIDKGKEGLESRIEFKNFIIEVVWFRGKIPCPFADPGVHPKLMASVFNKKFNKEIKFSQLNVHMIREHGFFEGKGSLFRLEPEELIKILEIK